MSVDPNILVNAIAASLGPAVAVGVGAFINWRATKMAEKAAMAAQKATAQAAADASRAQEATSRAAAQASEAARQLIITARESNAKLDQIVEVGVATHKIVNSQRTVMLNVVASLAERIAKENPHDEPAQLAAQQARADAATSFPDRT